MVNQNKSFGRLFFGVILYVIIPLALLVLVNILFSGCTSTKDVNKSSSTTEEKRTVDSASFWKRKAIESDSIATELKKEMNSQLEFQEEGTEELSNAFDQVKDLFYKSGLLNDTLNKRLKLIFDSLKNNPCKNSLTTNADGSFTAIGLKRANLQLLESSRKIELLNSQLEEEINKRIKVEEENKTVQSQKIVVKERSFLGFLNQWWWILVIVATAFFILGFRICWKYKDKIRAELANTDQSNAT